MQKLKTFLLLIIVFSFCGCTPAEKEDKLETLNIAFQTWVGYGPMYLAKEKGFFKEEGIDLLFVDEEADSARRDAFKAKMLDAEAGTTDLLVAKRAQDTPVVAVLEMDHSFGSDGIVAREEIKKLKDLLGKRVALSRDDVNETFLSYLFYKEGLSLKDIIIVSRTPEDVAKSFLNGEADACVTWEPWLSQALARPGAHLLISTRDTAEVILDTLNIREDILRNNPRIVKGLMRAWFKALNYYRQHPEESSEVIAKYYKISPQEYRKNVSGLKWIDYAQQDEEKEHARWLEIFDAISQIKFENNRIDKKPAAVDAVNRTLLKGLYENRQ